MASMFKTSATGIRVMPRSEVTVFKNAKNAEREAEFQMIYDGAHRAGMLAGERTEPTPMIVGTPSTLMGNDVDYSKKTYFVADGVCGFAWVVIKPATSAFAKWLKKIEQGRPGYGGGIHIWCKEFGQSMARKEDYAAAFADHLTRHGYPAYSQSRMD